MVFLSPKWNQGERLLRPSTMGSLRSLPKFISLCEQKSSSMARPPAVPAVAQVTSFTLWSTLRLTSAAAQSTGFTYVRFKQCMHAMLSVLNKTLRKCNLNYPDPFGHDAHMGIQAKRNSPDN